jgi:hypothetical protein
MGRMADHRGPRVVEERSGLAADALRELSRRLDSYRTSVDLGAGWERGAPGDWLKAILEDWRVFDAGAFQVRLDALRQQSVEISGHVLHVVHAEGRGPSPLPLLLTHGWPGSFLEYLPVLALLPIRARTAQIPPTRSRSSFRRCPVMGSAGRRRPRG